MVRVSVPLAVAVPLVVVVVTAGMRRGRRGCCCRRGGVVVVCDGDLLILLGLQLALVEAQRPLQDVLDLTGSRATPAAEVRAEGKHTHVRSV